MAERVETTFHMDFAIAERFGVKAVKDTYNRAFNDWKNDYRYLTELVMVLNHRCWYWYEKKNDDLSELYGNLFYKAQGWAYHHLKGEELDFFIEVTD